MAKCGKVKVFTATPTMTKPDTKPTMTKADTPKPKADSTKPRMAQPDTFKSTRLMIGY